MMEIVKEEIRNWRLRRNGHQSGVVIGQCRGAVETGVRNPPHPDLAIVVGHIFQQPFDRVVSVAAFIDCFDVVWIVAGNVGTHVVVLSLGHPTAPNILMHKNVLIILEVFRWGDRVWISIGSVRLDAVGRPLHQDGPRLRLITRRVDGRV